MYFSQSAHLAGSGTWITDAGGYFLRIRFSALWNVSPNLYPNVSPML